MQSSLGRGGVLLLLTIFPQACPGQFFAAELRALSRSGMQIGETDEVAVLAGTHVDEVTELVFSHPGIRAELRSGDPLPWANERVAEYGKFRVTVGAEVPAGRYEVRTRGRHGVSNPRAFLITPLENQVPSAASHVRTDPTHLPSQKLLHCRATPAEVDYFAIDIPEAKAVRIELYAQRLDSQLIGQLTLYDSDNHVLAASRGADDVDPQLAAETLPAGRYTLAVHDFTFRGGDEFHYQIVCRDASLDTPLFDGGGGAEGRLPQPSTVRSVTLGRHDHVDAPDPPTTSETVQLPYETTRWFPSGRDDSRFEFAAEKGSAYVLDVVSHRLGQPTDPRLTVRRVEPQEGGPPKLTDVINIDDSQRVSDGAMNLSTKDPVALLTVPQTGKYQLLLRDLDDGESLLDRQSYTLRIHPAEPEFDLVAYRPYPHRDVNLSRPAGTNLFRGGTESIRVLVVRRGGAKDSIRVFAEGLPDGVTATEAVIGPNQSMTQLNLTASEDAKGALGAVRIMGRSEGGITRQAAAATLVAGKGHGRNYVRSRLASDLKVSVSEQDLSPITFHLASDKVHEVKTGATLELPITVTRREGGKAAGVVRARDLPPRVAAADVTIAADKSEARVQLKVNANASPGTYSLWFQVETKIKLKRNPQALQREQAYRELLESKKAEGESSELQAAIAEADKRVAAAQGLAKEQELTVFLPTNNAVIRIIKP